MLKSSSLLKFSLTQKHFFNLTITTEGFLHPFCRNILKLTNHFEISDQNITLLNYQEWIQDLNAEHPDEVANLNLTKCELQQFLDQVFENTHTLIHCISTLCFLLLS